MPKSKNEISICKQLDLYCEEIKNLILMNSSSNTANILNKKYEINVTRRDIDNFLYNHQKDFNVIAYRKQHQKFDFGLARKEDAKKEFQPRLP